MTRRASDRRARLLDVASVATPAVLAAALVLVDLGSRSIWLDESASVTIASQHGAALVAAMARDGGNMLAYYALLHVLVGAFGRGVLVLRAPSALAATLAVLAVSVLARRLYDRRVAFVSGVLSAVSLPLVFWGQDARAYAPLVALVAASFLAFVALVERAPGSPSSRVTWTAYVVVTNLALYMSVIAALAIAAQVVVLATRRERARTVLAALVLVALCAAPLAYLAKARGSGQLFWVPAPSLSQVGGIVETVTSAAFTPDFARTATSSVLEWGTVVLLAVFAAAPWIARLRRAGTARARVLGPHERLRRHVLLAWLATPVLLALVESAAGQPIADPRNLLVAMPPVGIALAAVTVGDELAPPRHPARYATLGWCLVAALVALRALQLAPSYAVSPENWRAAVAYVLDTARPGDCVAFYPEDGRMAFAYYLPGGPAARAAPRSVLPVAAWGVDAPYVERYATLTPAQLDRVSASCTHLFLVASHQGQRTGTSGSVAHFRRYEALDAHIASRYAHRRVATFGYAAVIDVTVYAH